MLWKPRELFRSLLHNTAIVYSINRDVPIMLYQIGGMVVLVVMDI